MCWRPTAARLRSPRLSGRADRSSPERRRDAGRRQWPATRRSGGPHAARPQSLFMTGYAQCDRPPRRLDAGVHLIGKPFSFHELAAKVRERLDGRRRDAKRQPLCRDFRRLGRPSRTPFGSARCRRRRIGVLRTGRIWWDSNSVSFVFKGLQGGKVSLPPSRRREPDASTAASRSRRRAFRRSRAAVRRRTAGARSVARPRRSATDALVRSTLGSPAAARMRRGISGRAWPRRILVIGGRRKRIA